MLTVPIRLFLLFSLSFSFFNVQGQLISDSVAQINSKRPVQTQVQQQDYQQQLIDLTNKYETIRQEQQIQQQRNRIRFQNYLIIGISGLVLLGGLLVHSQYRRYKLSQESRIKSELIKQEKLAVKAVIEAEENERQRIARDLHDGIGQMMSAAKMNLSALESELKNGTEEQKKSLEKVITLVDESCKEIRTVSHIMMPNALLKNNLAAAIRDFVDKLNNQIAYSNCLY